MCEFNEKLFVVMLNDPHCSVWKTFASFIGRELSKLCWLVVVMVVVATAAVFYRTLSCEYMDSRRIKFRWEHVSFRRREGKFEKTLSAV